MLDMKKEKIRNYEDLIDLTLEYGFLPFFRNAVTGFSVEEMCPPELWFTEAEGPWEWKGPVIRDGRCAYGKFFRGKAVYVSLEMLPHLCNYRRDGYDFDARCDDGLVHYRDKEIYGLIQQRGRITSKDLRKELCRDKDADKYLTRLQMQTYITSSDFVYERDKNGRRYGWGIAEYSTPEFLYGRDTVRSGYGDPPERSLEIIAERILKAFPEPGREAVIRFIK